MKTKVSGQNAPQLSLEELSSSLQMYRQLVDNIREVLWIVSPDWQEVIYISPAYEQVWGRSCESLRQNPMSWIDSVLEEDREKITADIEKRSEGQIDDPFFPDYRILRPDGTVRWISARAYPVQDDQGPISRIAGIAEDITEQVNAVQALSDSEGLLRTITENIPNTYLSIIEKDMTVGFTSGEEFRKQGLAPGAFVGLSIDEVFGEYAPYISEQYQRVFSGEEVQFELIFGDQEQEYNVIPLADENGAVNRILAFVENVTERKEAARKLQESEEKFRTAFRTSPDAIAISRISDGVLVDVNDAYVTGTGYSRKEIIGKSAVDLGLWADPSEREQLMSLVAEKGSVTDFEVGLNIRGGTVRTGLLSASSLLLEGQSHLITIVRDITERVAWEDALRESEEKFRTAFRTSPDSITISRMSDGVLVDVNDSFLTESGFSRKEAIGKSTVDLGLWADPSEREQFISIVAEKGSVTNFEMSFSTGDGEVGTSLLSASSFLLEGQPHLLTIVRDITERVAWEDALRDSEEKFRTAFRTSPDSITISRTSDGLMVEINEGFTTRTGYSSEEVIGKTAVDLGLWIDPSERDRFVSLLAEKGSVENLEMDFRTKDGAVRTGLMSVSALILGGEPHHISIIRDITGMKESQETVRRERDLIDRLMETSPVGITVVGGDGQINFANRRAVQILGLEKDMIQERTYNAPEWQITDFVGKPVPDDELPFMRVRSTSEPVFDVRHAILWPNGRMVKLSINAAPLFDELDQFDGMVASIEDITDRVASEDALSESEERFRNIVQSSPMGMHMYRLEPDGRLVFVGANPVADRVLGVDNSQFMGKTIEEAFPPLKDTEVPEAYRKVCESGTPWYTEQISYEHGKISGAFEVHAFQTSPNTMAVMFLEITERLQAQEQIRESLKVKETLLKEIHHRVKNNLQVISGLLDLQKHHLDDEKYRKIFKESQNRVLAMALIHQELYRAEDLESINFGEFIKNLSRTLIASYTLDAEVVKLELDVQDANIVIDTAIPCGLIINELLTNSIKHAFPEGHSGTILVTFRAVGEEEFELIVSDDGVGLPEGLDFTRTGSLGLQLVSILSDQLKCSVTLEREGGTSFSFRFKEYREAGTALY